MKEVVRAYEHVYEVKGGADHPMGLGLDEMELGGFPMRLEG